MTDSQSLLADYAHSHSESAFRALVNQYLDLVYSSAFRLLDGDAHRAKDVAQIVFVDLARKAGDISPDVMLGGWLHRHTCFVTVNLQRSERRRLTREREAVEMKSLHEDVGIDFSSLSQLLDDSINQLPEADRIAIILRFFEQKDFRSVGQSLDTSEDAARMRVNRALDKLRDLLAQRGIRTAAASLGIVISTNAVQAVPVGLALTISTAVLGGTVASTATVVAATTNTITMTTFQKMVVTATIAVLAGVGIYEAYRAAQLRKQVQSLRQQQMSLLAQTQQLQQEHVDATSQLSALRENNERLSRNANELLKLRGEVGLLRRLTNELIYTHTNPVLVGRSYQWPIVTKVAVNHINQPQDVSDEVIRTNISVKVGDTFNPASVTQDVLNLRATGWFYRVNVARTETNGEMVLDYEIEERPKLIGIQFTGNTNLLGAELTKILRSKVGGRLDERALSDDASLIESLYVQSGILDLKVRYRTSVDEKTGEGNAVFSISNN